MFQFERIASSRIASGKKTVRDTGGLNRSDSNDKSLRHLRLGVAATLLAASTMAYAQAGTMPDSQVEANVLKALAGAPELGTEAITTKTVYGTVTLSGTVSSEAQRSRAETLASNAPGVKKVVDELALGTPGGASDGQPEQANLGAPGPDMVLQSDGTYAPATDAGQASAGALGTTPGMAPGQAVRNNPDADQALDQQMEAQQTQQNGQQAGANPGGSQPQNGYPQNGYPQTGYPQAQGYPQNSYPPAPGYPQGGPGHPQGYPQQRGYGSPPAYAAPMDGGQVAGQTVSVPSGTLIRLRVNQRISSDRSKPGDAFDGIVVNDVVAGGVIAIPRGAAVKGTVLDAKASGALKGRGELSLQLNQVTLAGKSYPIVSDTWAHNGADKTIETVNKTAGFGAVGALLGAVAGGGVGAAVGGGVGAAAGLGSSAASGRGQVLIPSEAVVTFHLAQPATVKTVSEQEMQRLAYGVPVGGEREMQRRYPYPRPYYYPYPPVYGYPY